VVTDVTPPDPADDGQDDGKVVDDGDDEIKAKDDDDNGGGEKMLTNGAVIGIVIGVVIFALLVASLAFVFVYRAGVLQRQPLDKVHAATGVF